MNLLGVDVVSFLNDVTDGHLLAWKVVVTTVVFALAGLQVALAARFWGATDLVPISTGAAARTHRIVGTVTVALALVVAFSCLIGPAGETSPRRVLLHSIFGTLVFVVLVVKFTLLKLTPSGNRFLPYAGVLLFLAFGAVWVTSVADYVTT